MNLNNNNNTINPNYAGLYRIARELDWGRLNQVGGAAPSFRQQAEGRIVEGTWDTIKRCFLGVDATPTTASLVNQQTGQTANYNLNVDLSNRSWFSFPTYNFCPSVNINAGGTNNKDDEDENQMSGAARAGIGAFGLALLLAGIKFSGHAFRQARSDAALLGEVEDRSRRLEEMGRLPSSDVDFNALLHWTRASFNQMEVGLRARVWQERVFCGSTVVLMLGGLGFLGGAFLGRWDIARKGTMALVGSLVLLGVGSCWMGPDSEGYLAGEQARSQHRNWAFVPEQQAPDYSDPASLMARVRLKAESPLSGATAPQMSPEEQVYFSDEITQPSYEKGYEPSAPLMVQDPAYEIPGY